MPETIEVDEVDAWLHATLTALPALAGVGVHPDAAPPEATFPFVVYALTENHDVAVVGGLRIMVAGTYVVRATTEGTSYTPLVPLAAAVRGALHRASAATVAPGSVLGCVQTATVRYRSTEGGRPYVHLGGLFDLSIQAAAA